MQKDALENRNLEGMMDASVFPWSQGIVPIVVRQNVIHVQTLFRMRAKFKISEDRSNLRPRQIKLLIEK